MTAGARATVPQQLDTTALPRLRERITARRVVLVWNEAGALGGSRLLAGRRSPVSGRKAASAGATTAIATGRKLRATFWSRLDRLTWETEVETVQQPGDAVGIHLELVAGAEVGERERLGPRDAAEVDE